MSRLHACSAGASGKRSQGTRIGEERGGEGKLTRESTNRSEEGSVKQEEVDTGFKKGDAGEGERGSSLEKQMKQKAWTERDLLGGIASAVLSHVLAHIAGLRAWTKVLFGIG